MTRYKIEQTGTREFGLWRILDDRDGRRPRNPRKVVDKWEFLGNYTSLEAAEAEMRKETLVVIFYDEKGDRIL